jgi:hypothetical protein
MTIDKTSTHRAAQLTPQPSLNYVLIAAGIALAIVDRERTRLNTNVRARFGRGTIAAA